MEIFGLAVALLLVAFFAGIEIAFVSANKLRVELLKEKGSTRARIISNFNSNPGKFISSMLIGLNISLVLFGSITTNYFVQKNFGFLPSSDHEVSLLIIQTLFTTVIILIFGELVPKILFRVNSDQTLLVFSYVIQLFYWLLSPIAGVFHNLARMLIKLITRRDFHEGGPSFTKEDLEYLVKETAVSDEDGQDESDHLNSEIFEKALYLKDVKVRNCMVPRPEIQAVDAGEEMDTLRKKFIESKLSRILVYSESIDKITGYIHHFDMLKSPKQLKEVIRPIPVIPATMTARDLLLQFIRERKNIAWVVDEYGGTAGIITLEDLMEQIFGEIHDEHDEEEMVQKRVDDKEFIFSGRLEIDYLNREFDLNIPEGDYTTLSGYIINRFEDIPEPGKQFEEDGFIIKILRGTETRIELVNIKLKEKEER